MKPININGMTEDDIITWWKKKRENWNKKSNNERKYREDEKLLIYRYIHELMRRGFTRKNIVHHLMDKIDKMSYDSATNFTKEAIQYLVADADDTLDETREIARERLTDIYKKAVENNQPKIALTALNELNKINGLHENKVEVKTDATITFEFS